MEKENQKQTLSLPEIWQTTSLRITDEFSSPPIMLRIDDSIIGTLGSFEQQANDCAGNGQTLPLQSRFLLLTIGSVQVGYIYNNLNRTAKTFAFEKRKVINQLKFNNMNAAQAKTIKIADYLQSLGYSPAKIQGYNYWYLSPYREERTASFKVDMAKNTWHDFGTGEGGDIIDLAQKIWNCSVETALQKLSETPTNLSFFQSKNILQDNPTTIITDICPIAHPKLIEWVKERRIDLALANLYCREIHYQNQSGQFFSVGFRNDKGGYELNSPNNFKGCIPPKEITTIQNSSNVCLVFEGFWDFLSYLTIQKIERTKHDVAVLNSTANTKKAMNFLKTHREIYTYLDNDASGRKATELIKSANLTVYNHSTQFADYKDLNDYLRGKKLLLKKQVRKGFKL